MFALASFQSPISMLFQNPIAFVIMAAALVASISIHEFAHAYASWKLGDPTAKAMGRVTLNPLSHLDPLGTAMLLLVGFGWGKPVPFDPTYLKNPKKDAAVISFAGPLSNFLLALILSVVINLVTLHPVVFSLGYLLVGYNLLLGFFNLIPLHPLDGFKVVNGFLPEDLSNQWLQSAPYGIFILMIMIFTGTTRNMIGSFLSFSLNLLGF